MLPILSIIVVHYFEILLYIQIRNSHVHAKIIFSIFILYIFRFLFILHTIRVYTITSLCTIQDLLMCVVVFIFCCWCSCYPLSMYIHYFSMLPLFVFFTGAPLYTGFSFYSFSCRFYRSGSFIEFPRYLDLQIRQNRVSDCFH